MKGSFAAHVRGIVVDSILYGFRALFSHLLLFLRMVLAIITVNLGIFLLFGGIAAIFFEVYRPHLIETAKAHLAQTITLNTSLESIAVQIFNALQLIQEDLMRDQAGIDSLIKYVLVGVLFLMIVQLLMAAWTSLGVQRIFLDVYDSSKSRVSRLFSVIRYIPRFIGSSCVALFLGLLPMLILSGLGFYVSQLVCTAECGYLRILFMIPAMVALVYYFVRVKFFPLLIIDRDAGVIQSVTQSLSMTRGFTFSLMLQVGAFWFIGFGVALIPFVGTVINLLIVYPVQLLSFVYTYRYMEKHR